MDPDGDKVASRSVLGLGFGDLNSNNNPTVIRRPVGDQQRIPPNEGSTTDGTSVLLPSYYNDTNKNKQSQPALPQQQDSNDLTSITSATSGGTGDFHQHPSPSSVRSTAPSSTTRPDTNLASFSSRSRSSGGDGACVLLPTYNPPPSEEDNERDLFTALPPRPPPPPPTAAADRARQNSANGTQMNNNIAEYDGDNTNEYSEDDDEFYDDSALNSLLQEQFANSLIRLPFVPVVVTGQDMTVEPSIEPQVPIAVAPVSVRNLSSNNSNRTNNSNAHDSQGSHGSGSHEAPLPRPSRSLPLQQLSELRQQGFPVGLALEVSDSRTGFPVRFWSIDNSTSMDEAADACKQVKFHADTGRTTVERCSRWAELQGSVEDHIQLAGLIKVSTVFCLRNGQQGHRKFAVADPTSRNVENDVRLALRSVHNARAVGMTPLSKHLREFKNRITILEPTLRKQGQKAVIVLSTGSMPTDSRGRSSVQANQEFIDALVEINQLPAWIFIRLCTDDKEVVEFYNNLTMLELPMVVIGKLCFSKCLKGCAKMSMAPLTIDCSVICCNRRFSQRIQKGIRAQSLVKLCLVLAPEPRDGIPRCHFERYGETRAGQGRVTRTPRYSFWKEGHAVSSRHSHGMGRVL